MNTTFSIKFVSIFLTVLLAVIASAVTASDLDKEKRWADQVVDAILDGEAVWLNDGSNDFLGIFTEAEEKSARAVIIMHGTGIHPDWQQVVQPLRVGLTEHNWNTLSIQMPVLANDAEYIDYAPLYDEVAPRIDAAIKYLQTNSIKEIVLIGHSQGAAMAAYYLSSYSQKVVNQVAADYRVAGFIAIGMPASAKDLRMDSINSLRQIHVPILDLYGKEDLEGIIDSAKDRVATTDKSGNKNYTQVVIEGNHFFDGIEEALVEAISGWLSSISDL